MLRAELSRRLAAPITQSDVVEYVACCSGFAFDLIATRGRFFGASADCLVVASVTAYVFAYLAQGRWSPLYRFLRWTAFGLLGLGLAVAIVNAVRVWASGSTPGL